MEMYSRKQEGSILLLSLLRRIKGIIIPLVIAVSIALSELLTSLMSIALQGRVTSDYLITGGVVSFLVSGVVVYFLMQIFMLSEGNVNLRKEIATRQEAEERLRKSEEKYRIVADNTYDWEFWINPDNSFIYTSPSCEKITGYPARDFQSDPGLINRIVHAEDLDAFNAHRHVARDLKKTEETEFRIIRPDGSIVWISHNCQPVYDEQGRFIGTRGSNRDITIRRSIEEERKKLIVELQNALAKVKRLSGLFPICSSCKNIRDDKGYWIRVESYIRDHSEAEFSHSLCPDCAKKLYPQYCKEIFDEKKE